MAVLQIARCRCAPWGQVLLRDIDVTLAAGEILAVIGPNGAGKTTLLKLMNGTVQPNTGSVTLGDRPLADWPRLQRARALAVMPQQYALGFTYSAEEVILLGRTPHRSGDHADRAILNEVLAATDTTSLRHRIYLELSGGEQQRVQLARVFAQIWRARDSELRLLLLDEPTAALDLAHQQLVLTKVRRLAQTGCAVVMVLHDFNLAATCAHRLLALQEGRQVRLGPPEDVLSPSLFREVFGVEVSVVAHPRSGLPWVLPL